MSTLKSPCAAGFVPRSRSRMPFSGSLLGRRCSQLRVPIGNREPDLNYGRHLNDTRAIGLNIIKDSSANTVGVARRARAVLAEMKDDRFPTSLSSWNDGDLAIGKGATHFGYVFQGEASLTRDVESWLDLKSGYFEVVVTDPAGTEHALGRRTIRKVGREMYLIS